MVQWYYNYHAILWIFFSFKKQSSRDRLSWGRSRFDWLSSSYTFELWVLSESTADACQSAQKINKHKSKHKSKHDFYTINQNMTHTCTNSFSLSSWPLHRARLPEGEAPARLRNFALCWMFFSLASTGFLEYLKMPTDGALSTICLPSPCH